MQLKRAQMFCLLILKMPWRLATNLLLGPQRSNSLAGPRAGTLRALRINGLDTRAGISDLDALLGSAASPDFLVLPKTETGGHLQILDRLLTAVGKATRLVGLIESAAGLAAVEAISTATPRLAALMLGAADMSADLGAATAWQPLAYARGRLIAACALGDVLAIDSPFFELHDEAGLKQEVTAAVALGFGAKAAIHPAQIGPINAALTPSAEAVENARELGRFLVATPRHARRPIPLRWRAPTVSRRDRTPFATRSRGG